MTEHEKVVDVTGTVAINANPTESPADPIPLDLDWESPEGKAHHKQMSKLPPDNPVAIAHFKNIGQPHPREGEVEEAR